MEDVLFAWSGGKDSSLALYECLNSKKYNILALLTTVTEGYNRISMHGVRNELLEKQAELIGLPLQKVVIPQKCSDEDYQNKMIEVLNKYKERGITSVIFGDIFLEDVRKYREDNLSKVDLTAILPLWGIDSKELSKRFIDLGFKSIITCVDTEFLPDTFAGRDYDFEFLSDLPENADPCGENGEFHSFVYDGPIFKEPILVDRGEKVLRNDRFYYCDLIPV